MSKILFLFLLVLPEVFFGQSVGSIIEQKRLQIERVEVEPSERITYISSNFANPQIKTINLRDKVNKLAVLKVYYVYTAYRKSINFDQKALDRKRFEELKTLYPSLFENSLIEWEILEQTGVRIHTEGEGYFHGFILVHRPLPSDEGRKKEFELVNRFFENPEAGATLIEEDPIANLLVRKTDESTKFVDRPESLYEGGDQALLEHIQANFEIPADVWKERKDFWAKFSIIVKENGQPELIGFNEAYGKSLEKAIERTIAKMPIWDAKVTNGKTKSDTVNFEWRVSYSPNLKGQYLKNGKPPILNHKLSDFGMGMSSDPTQSNTIGVADIVEGVVYKAFSNIPKDENLAIVMDVTGSMANHIISASFWLNQNKEDLPFTSFTAFNDGDDMQDSEKEIGATGGIYFNTFVSEFANGIRTAMLNGNGGDYPENDIEAILFASRKDPKATGVLLVADNFSSVKDFELLPRITLPVSIMPCGLTGSIHQNYLDIVFKTKGKIYYNDQVIDVQTFAKGDTLKIRKTTYVFTGRGLVVKPR